MSRRQKYDENQCELDFSGRVRQCLTGIGELTQAIYDPPEKKRPNEDESREEFLIEVAAACKRALRDSGLSREQFVDKVNDIYCGDTDPSETDHDRRQLSIHMLNNYLSKPVEYKIPAWLIRAIRVVTGSNAPLEPFLLPGEQVISAHESKELKLGKLIAAKKKASRLERELSCELAAQYDA